MKPVYGFRPAVRPLLLPRDACISHSLRSARRDNTWRRSSRTDKLHQGWSSVLPATMGRLPTKLQVPSGAEKDAACWLGHKLIQLRKSAACSSIDIPVGAIDMLNRRPSANAGKLTDWGRVLDNEVGEITRPHPEHTADYTNRSACPPLRSCQVSRMRSCIRHKTGRRKRSSANI